MSLSCEKCSKKELLSTRNIRCFGYFRENFNFWSIATLPITARKKWRRTEKAKNRRRSQIYMTVEKNSSFIKMIQNQIFLYQFEILGKKLTKFEKLHSGNFLHQKFHDAEQNWEIRSFFQKKCQIGKTKIKRKKMSAMGLKPGRSLKPSAAGCLYLPLVQKVPDFDLIHSTIILCELWTMRRKRIDRNSINEKTMMHSLYLEPLKFKIF